MRVCLISESGDELSKASAVWFSLCKFVSNLSFLDIYVEFLSQVSTDNFFLDHEVK